MSIEDLHNLFKKCSGVSTDSRNTGKDELFFSLKGPNFNGNKYAKKAIESGAKYAVVDEKEFAIDERYILVKNCLESLQELSNYHRNKLKVKVIGITGSNGKTTSKELINSVLKTNFKTSYTTGNLNNHIGVPLTLLKITSETEIAIIEMGANHIGEIALLSEICNPDFGYITNFGKAHLEGFGSEEGVIKGKKELYDYIKRKKGLIFQNNDDHKQIKCVGDYQNVFCFGKSNGDIKYLVKSVNPEIEIKVNETLINSSLFGDHNVENIMAAVAIGKYFKIDLEKIKIGIEDYISSNNRSQIIKKGSNKIMLDAYNANPSSMYAAIKFFENFSEKNKILILGDMFELGKDSKKYHQEIAEYCRLIKDTKIFLVGELFYNTTRFKEFNYSENIDNLISKGDLSKIKKSCLFIKGSRGLKLEKLMDNI